MILKANILQKFTIKHDKINCLKFKNRYLLDKMSIVGEQYKSSTTIKFRMRANNYKSTDRNFVEENRYQTLCKVKNIFMSIIVWMVVMELTI